MSHDRPVVIALHGIWTSSRRVSWGEEFEDFAARELDVRPRKYGWSSGLLSYLPFYRDWLVDWEEEYVRRLYSDERRPPSIVAHSFGAYIVHELMAKRRIRFDRVVLIAAAVPEEADWYQFASRFNKCLVYWSPQDEVLGLSTYGRMGLVGPRVEHPRVTAVKTGESHGGYLKPEYFRQIIEFVRSEDRRVQRDA